MKSGKPSHAGRFPDFAALHPGYITALLPPSNFTHNHAGKRPTRSWFKAPVGAMVALVRLDAGGVPLVARITRRSAARLELRPGLNVWAQVKAVALVG